MKTTCKCPRCKETLIHYKDNLWECPRYNCRRVCELYTVPNPRYNSDSLYRPGLSVEKCITKARIIKGMRAYEQPKIEVTSVTPKDMEEAHRRFKENLEQLRISNANIRKRIETYNNDMEEFDRVLRKYDTLVGAFCGLIIISSIISVLFPEGSIGRAIANLVIIISISLAVSSAIVGVIALEKKVK